MNDSQYPWLILVPRYSNLRDLHDLSKVQLAEVMEEVRLVSDILVEEFKAFKINVAALGNMVPQLHIHVIARYEDDPAWPGPVWGVHPAKAYDSNKAKALKVILETAIERGSIKPE